MAKIYFLAVNWDRLNASSIHTATPLFLQKHEARPGVDIADLMGQFPAEKGWRVYPHTLKRELEDAAQVIIGRWVAMRSMEA